MPGLHKRLQIRAQATYRFLGIDSWATRVQSRAQADRYDNPISTRFLAPIDCYKIPALAYRYENPIPTWFLGLIDCSKIPALAYRYDNPIPTRFLAPLDCYKISALYFVPGGVGSLVGIHADEQGSKCSSFFVLV
jgi:hypothetical protein